MTARDLPQLSVVHEFFVCVLRRQLGHELPIPNDLLRSALSTAKAETIQNLRHWLNLLDLSISPTMLRDDLAGSGPDTAAALLWFYTHKTGHVGLARDKADFVVTWIYRDSVESGAWAEAGAFEKHIAQITRSSEAKLPDEHRQALRQFDLLQAEIDQARHFDTLVDSSIVQRVREIKASLGDSFYHPAVLATVAAYNVHFGERFDELFKSATKEIKQFAESVQREGGSAATPVDGDVTVQQLHEIEDKKILTSDYRDAQEQFRKISKLKKAVDRKKKPATQAAKAAPREMPADAEIVRGFTSMVGEVASDDRLALMVPNESLLAAQMEESKLGILADSIRQFVKAADPSHANVVPVKHGRLILTPQELDAFRSDYLEEKSFRADFANAMIKIVSCCARMDSELEEFNRLRNSAYLWKPHADSLTNLVKYSQAIAVDVKDVRSIASQRGLANKVEGLDSAIAKMREKVQAITTSLSQLA